MLEGAKILVKTNRMWTAGPFLCLKPQQKIAQKEFIAKFLHELQLSELYLSPVSPKKPSNGNVLFGSEIKEGIRPSSIHDKLFPNERKYLASILVK